ncbi:site-specific integrase [Leisingera sp. ANG59]|uniref:site-specific integrase n=1 Tax=Leisingera sp. ANG59 TaxID=2675221 RepID=UPI001571E1B9|nr:site-specific integrase [Leisingera sp. ANG59]
MINTRTSIPSVAAGLYEAALASAASPNTLSAELQGIRPLFTWADQTRLDLDARLLSGGLLEPREIRAFATWLHRAFLEAADRTTFPSENIKGFNTYLFAAQRMMDWFHTQYAADAGHLPRNIAVAKAIETTARVWRERRKRTRVLETAPDLEEDGIAEIETFLHSAASAPSPDPLWVRGYLIWRLAIEFGFRIGEILALRLEDCPTRMSRAFCIVRVEDRIGPPDPRGKYAPRPKTLGRELEPVIARSAFPRLLIDYMTTHRVSWRRSPSGARLKRPVVHHTYLVVNDKGDPLPQRSATNLAAYIARETGVDFTWHLARHAFFNRAYEAVARLEDPTQREVRTGDLVYWGGWSDPESLNIYIRRARQQRARTALRVWGSAALEWKALSPS